MSKFKFELLNLFNMDETGFSTIHVPDNIISFSWQKCYGWVLLALMYPHYKFFLDNDSLHSWDVMDHQELLILILQMNGLLSKYCLYDFYSSLNLQNSTFVTSLTELRHAFYKKSRNIIIITSNEIAGLLNKAHSKVASLNKRISGFKTTGIFLINPSHFSDEDFIALDENMVTPLLTMVTLLNLQKQQLQLLHNQ